MFQARKIILLVPRSLDYVTILNIREKAKFLIEAVKLGLIIRK